MPLYTCPLHGITEGSSGGKESCCPYGKVRPEEHYIGEGGLALTLRFRDKANVQALDELIQNLWAEPMTPDQEARATQLHLALMELYNSAPNV